MSKTITSSGVAFMDLTDGRKLDAYITSNLPIAQIYNQNTKIYSPDWNTENLQLSADIYLDAKAVTSSTYTSIIWYKKVGAQFKEQVGSGATLTITSNQLTGDVGIITYLCEATYKDTEMNPPTAHAEITFTRVDTGIDGVSISSTTVSYGESDSPSVQPTSWQSTIPDVSEGKYLWTRTIIDYTDTNKPDTVTYTYTKQGTKGDPGDSGSSVTVSSVQYQAGSSATSAPTGTWSSAVVAVDDGSYLWTKTTFSDGKVAYGVARQGLDGTRGDDGRGISSIVEQYYQSTSATAQSGGSWSATVPTWADGKYIWTRSVITYTDSTTSTTSPVCVTGQKGGTGGAGAPGVGISSVDVWYYQSTSATSLSGGSWSTTSPAWVDGKYVWTKTITTYTNSTTDETAAVCITGQKGSTGVGIKSVAEYYLATSSSSGVTISTTGWTPAIQTISADKKYLWNYEVITYTDNTTSTTSPIIIGAFGNTGSTGATGKGIKSVTEYYLATTASSGVTTSTTGWKDTMQSLTATNKYLWNYELITYTDNTTATIAPVIIGVYGDKGVQGDRGAGISSVTVTYGTSTSASTQPTSWQTTIPNVAEGAYLWTRTVTDYTDASIADTVALTYAKQGAKGDVGSPGTPITVSSIQYQAGISATSAPTGTWSNSVVTVAEGSYLWTKTTFSDGKVAYGVAKQGATGAPASLVNVVPSANYFKSTTGKDGTFTPEYIYLYPRFQTVTFSKWEYSVNGGTTWVATSGANGLSIGTYNSIANTLRIARTSTLYTDTVTSISFRCVSSNAAVYDTVSIAKIYDVVDLQIGGRNLYLDTKNYGGNSPDTSVWNYGSSGVLDGTYLGLNVVKITSQWGRRWQSIPLTKLSLGGIYTMSAWIKNPGGDDDGYRTRISYFRDTSENAGSTYTILSSNFTPYTYAPTEWTRISVTFRVDTITDYTQHCRFRFEPYTDDSANHLPHLCVCGLKFEAGNKVTDWSPAPEDAEANIVKVDKRITDSLVDFKTTTDSISSKVSKTEESIETINGNISSLSTQISEAEQKITSDAIVSTVRQSTDYIDDLGKKVGTNEIISKINQTAEAVTISASRIGLLGATNIPDLTADKIKGGTLTLGGSSATTQNGQMIVKNASNTDVLKLNKDGVIVRSGHLAVAEDFTDQVFDWSNGNWLAIDKTRQLELGDNYIRMGVYNSGNYTNNMYLLHNQLNFSGHGEGIGLWGSSIGHDDYGYFTIKDHIRGDIYIKGQDDVTLANINSDGLYVNGPVYGGIVRGNAKQLSNVFVEHFPGSHNGYIGIRLGTTTKYDNSMITIKGHVTSYQDSTSFEASCYYYYEQDKFYGAVATATNPDVLKEVYFAEETSTGYVFLLLGGVDSTWNYPTVSIESISIGYNGHDASEWNSEWWASTYQDLSEFTRVSPCVRGGMSKILWSGAVATGSTITLDENFRNFKFLTCIIGSNSSPYGIVLGSFLDDSVTELHFFASTAITGTTVGKDFYVAKFNVIDKNKLSLSVCATATNTQAYVRKIVGWR